MSHTTNISVGSRNAVRVVGCGRDEDTRALYRESLRVAGCDVVDAADGREALVKALVHRPALVITETRLPIFDGYALCQILRHDSMTRDVPILVVTGETQPNELDRARDAGADVVLTKPVSFDALLTEIQRLLRRPERATESSAAGTSSKGHCRTPVAEAYQRLATTPRVKPPTLVCPTCDTPLVHERSHVGGVSKQPEQWDDYSCRCGTFVYRHRTRRLRRVG